MGNYNLSRVLKMVDRFPELIMLESDLNMKTNYLIE